ncbi:HTH_Tnp_Tc3_2 domain-containing protein [Trichonephila clavipes]|nr:HTH_Tnp_Tc3_2 domain-containing protein [Trichonephila clavipes]
MRYWDQRIRGMSFTQRPGSERPRKTSRREDPHIVRNARVQPTDTSTAIQVQVAPSLGAPVSSRTIRSDESRFNLSSDDPLERLNPAFSYSNPPLLQLVR